MILAREKRKFSPNSMHPAMEIMANRLSQPSKLTTSHSNATSPDLQDLCRTELLSPEEERCLFQRLAEVKAQEAELSAMSIDLQCVESTRELQRVRDEIVQLRNHIVESNLRLVVSVAAKFRSAPQSEFHELISEGSSILLRAVDLFDVTYGYRFSTYATTALRRGFMNLCNVHHRQHQRFISGQAERLDDLVGAESDVSFGVDSTDDIRNLLNQLEDRERIVIEDRFGLRAGVKAKTYREIGEKLQLSKERIRQIVVVALAKMKTEAEERRIGEGPLL